MNIEAGPQVSSLHLSNQLDAVRWARSHTRAKLNEWQLDQELIDTALLIVSELATNALKSKTEPTTYTDLLQAERLRLVLHWGGSRLVVEVTDLDPNPPVMGQPGLDDENGRGLVLVNALSARWGYYNCGRLKTVWAEVARA